MILRPSLQLAEREHADYQPRHHQSAAANLTIPRCDLFIQFPIVKMKLVEL